MLTAKFLKPPKKQSTVLRLTIKKDKKDKNVSNLSSEQFKGHISFDRWHGKAFRIAQTPDGAAHSVTGEKLPNDPDRWSIVTPENGVVGKFDLRRARSRARLSLISGISLARNFGSSPW